MLLAVPSRKPIEGKPLQNHSRRPQTAAFLNDAIFLLLHLLEALPLLNGQQYFFPFDNLRFHFFPAPHIIRADPDLLRKHMKSFLIPLVVRFRHQFPRTRHGQGANTDNAIFRLVGHNGIFYIQVSGNSQLVAPV